MQLVIVLCLCLVALTGAQQANRDIFDPFYVFCGPKNCYDVLGVDRADDIGTISKAYRSLSRTLHPDKVHPDKRVNVTEQFRDIAKAYEVLKGNESRPNFDWYLDHPRQYFKATGKHAWRALPKIHPILVALLALLTLSGAGHMLQISRHRRAAAALQEQIKAGLSLAKGGTKLALDLHTKAVAQYENMCKINGIKLVGSPFSSPAAKEKMQADPNFDLVCGLVMQEIKDWGDFAEPTSKDILIIKVFTVWPFSIVNGCKTFYRRYLSGLPLSAEDQEDMARSSLGPAQWESLSAGERKAAIDQKVWESAAYDAWNAARDGVATISKRQAKKQAKAEKYGATQNLPPRDLTE